MLAQATVDEAGKAIEASLTLWEQRARLYRHYGVTSQDDTRTLDLLALRNMAEGRCQALRSALDDLAELNGTREMVGARP